ncbi:MAG: TatD family hydrolase [Rikenellaceae bacterium]
MVFVDTHAHLYSSQFEPAESDAAVERATEAGVTRILLPDVDSTSREALEALSSRHICCYPMVGLHPTSVNDNPAWRDELTTIEALLGEDSSRYCAVGEMGIDLYWSRDFEREQREAFAFQVELSLRHNLPIAVHARDAWEAIIEELTPFAARGVRGVIHAFSGEVEHYRKLLSLGDFLFGIGGVVTFKKSALAPVVAQMALEDLVLETDAPYLTPTPHRGKRNESAYIPLIAARIADLHAVKVEQVAAVTTANAERMFKI